MTRTMLDFVEVRWHGRGGQGAKTAALLLGEAAADAGLHIQAFPEYGPERMGAPVQSFTRISRDKINLHCHVTNPQVVAVLDPTLIGTAVDVTSGVPDDGLFVINTPDTPAHLRKRLGVDFGKVFTVDANRIAMETIGRPIPNTPMLGAVVKVTDILELEALLHDTQAKLEKKFASRPQIVEGNLNAIRRAYQEVQGE